MEIIRRLIKKKEKLSEIELPTQRYRGTEDHRGVIP